MAEKLLSKKYLDSISQNEPNFKPNKQKKKLTVSRAMLYFILVIYSIWILAPFLVILVTSFTTNAEYGEATGYVWWPKEFSLEGYKRLFTDDPFSVDGIPSLLVGFLNTMWITLIPLCSALLQSLLVAYCYWAHNFPAKNKLFMITVTLMFVPTGAFSFVSYMFYQNLGWTEGYAAFLPMVVPSLFASAGTVFFLRPYLDGISKEIVEAARMDGMGFWSIFFKIVIPLAKPALIAQFIFGFVGGYNNYTGALLYLSDQSESMWTLQISLQKLISYLSTSASGDYNFKCATAVMAMLPLVIVYIICQKFFIEGISFGGGKE